MPKITVMAGDEVFSFSDFENWCDTARDKFAVAGLRGADSLCVDTQDRLCRSGKEFMRAQDDGSFPVRVYRALCD
jgi:hypothetical protein